MNEISRDSMLDNKIEVKIKFKFKIKFKNLIIRGLCEIDGVLRQRWNSLFYIVCDLFIAAVCKVYIVFCEYIKVTGFS